MTNTTPTIIAVVAASLLCACGAADEPRAVPEPSPQGSAPSTPARTSEPAQPPAIRGIVTGVEDGSIRVEENPAEESGSPKASISVTPETVVLYRGGDIAAAAELTIGHNVSVWFTGPVAESYPVQAAAETIVIEPSVAP
ncbi:MAG: DUF3221 domain-containing protein [Gemmatimonadota bacterium]